MRQLLWIALGSALGSSLRYGADLAGSAIDTGGLPVATLLVNFFGSLLIGYLAGLWAGGGAVAPHPYKWHFWMTGFCGGFTTFSAFSWQVLELIGSDRAQLAGFYAAGSVGLGLFAVWAGLAWANARARSNSSSWQ